MPSEELDAENSYQDQVKLSDEKNAIAAFEACEKFNQNTKEMTRMRLQYLLAENEENIATNGKLWAERTRYKIDIDRKNASLAYLLQRTASALETVAASDNFDAKKKGKKDQKSAGVVKNSASKDARKKK